MTHNDETIAEKNKRIAEFMTLQPAYAHKKDEYGYTQTVDGFIVNCFESPYDIDGLKYHKSWDWLMPVVEKIEGLGYIFIIGKNEAGIACGRSSGLLCPEVNVKADTKIQTVYEAIIKFIEWYNAQQKQ